MPWKGRNSKNHAGVLFAFLVLTTSGKNLDENRGATGMIEEGFFCMCFFIFFIKARICQKSHPPVQTRPPLWQTVVNN